MDLGPGGASNKAARFTQYQNVPTIVASVISTGLATLHELDTVYGVEDEWLLLEISSVNNYNQQVLEGAVK